MIVEQAVAAGSLQLRVSALEHRVVHFDLATALAADEMMVPVTSEFVHQVSLIEMNGPCKPVLCKEIERPVYRRLGQAGQRLPGTLVDLSRREPRARMPKHV